MRKVKGDLLAAIDVAYDSAGSWRQLSALVGINHATLQYVASTGNCSARLERELRRKLRVPLPTRSYTPRPVTTKEQERRRAALGAQWRDVIDAGLATMERREQKRLRIESLYGDMEQGPD